MSYQKLDLRGTTELNLVRRGWFGFTYKLTDGMSDYGQLAYQGTLKCTAVAETATCKWIFKRERALSRAITITDETGQELGKATREWFSCKSLLSLNTGFQAKFYKPNIFSRRHFWESDGYGKIMHFKSSFWGLTDTIYIDQSMTPPALMPLLLFLGEHIAIMERRSQSHS